MKTAIGATLLGPLKDAAEWLAAFVSKNRETIAEGIGTAVAVIKSAFKIIGGIAAPVLKALAPLFKSLGPLFDALSPIAKITGTVLVFLFTVFAQVLTVAIKAVTWVVEGITGLARFLAELPGKIADFFAELPGKIVDFFESVPERIVTMFKEAIDALNPFGKGLSKESQADLQAESDRIRTSGGGAAADITAGALDMLLGLMGSKDAPQLDATAPGPLSALTPTLPPGARSSTVIRNTTLAPVMHIHPTPGMSEEQVAAIAVQKFRDEFGTELRGAAEAVG